VPARDVCAYAKAAYTQWARNDARVANQPIDTDRVEAVEAQGPVRMLAAHLQGIMAAEPWGSSLGTVYLTAGIVPLQGPSVMGSLKDDVFEGMTGLEPGSADRLYGDNELVNKHVFAGRFLANATDPLTVLPAGSVAREGLKSALQMCAYPIELELSGSARGTVAKHATQTLLADWHLLPSDGRCLQVSSKDGASSHPLLHFSRHGPSSRALVSPAVLCGVVGVRIDLAYSPNVRSVSSDAFFVPLGDMTFDAVLTVLRRAATRAARATGVDVLKARDAAEHAKKAEQDADAIESVDADAEAPATKPARSRSSKSRAAGFRQCLKHPLVIQDEKLRRRILDTKRWIPMTAATQAERCLQLARLMYAEACPLAVVEPDVTNVLDSEWVKALKGAETAKAMLDHVFRPVVACSHPPGRDATLFDVHDVAEYTVAQPAPAIELAITLLLRRGESFARMMPDLTDTRLSVAFPWVSPLVTSSSSSSRLMVVRGVPAAFDNQLRYFDMPPTHHVTYDFFCSLVRALPRIANRQHHAVALLQASGLPLRSASDTRPAPVWMGPELQRLLHLVAAGAVYPTSVSIEGQRRVKDYVQAYADARRSSAKRNSNANGVTGDAAKKPKAAKKVVAPANGPKTKAKPKPKPKASPASKPKAKPKPKAKAKAGVKPMAKEPSAIQSSDDEPEEVVDDWGQVLPAVEAESDDEEVVGFGTPPKAKVAKVAKVVNVAKARPKTPPVPEQAEPEIVRKPATYDDEDEDEDDERDLGGTWYAAVAADGDPNAV